jgi:hypothetical protein
MMLLMKSAGANYTMSYLLFLPHTLINISLEDNVLCGARGKNDPTASFSSVCGLERKAQRERLDMCSLLASPLLPHAPRAAAGCCRTRCLPGCCCPMQQPFRGFAHVF